MLICGYRLWGNLPVIQMRVDIRVLFLLLGHRAWFPTTVFGVRPAPAELRKRLSSPGYKDFVIQVGVRVAPL